MLYMVCACGSSRCKACRHVSQGSTFVSNVTQKSYNVISSNSLMNCNTTNVIYLISCKKCGVQYVGETSQKLRSRLNNHRNRLRMLSNHYLYKPFSLDGHSEDDILIMPIEKITSDDGASINTKRLEREDYWCREYCTIYP